ncbi:hypothetical protein G3T14_16920 [Methylobacterium sp. BTF04]|nr:hypothetical protein [Methylobacterium sp. BTF04]NEU13797.1 hypothetical protein [Methylobacterium sp. BTF04]
MLGRSGRDRVSEAVRAAEATTSGEIVVLVARQAGLYRSAPLVLALVMALALPGPLILLTPWSAASIALAQAALALVILLAGADSRLRLALVPRSIRRSRAHEAALREFAARGVSRTRGRTGILIYLACAEGHAEIVADTAVASRLPSAAWSGAITVLLEALRRGEMESGLVAAIGQVGTILADALPAAPGDSDELPNRVIVLD